MKIYDVFDFANGNSLLIYQDEYEGYAELYYHDSSKDKDTFICEVCQADINSLFD